MDLPVREMYGDMLLTDCRPMQVLAQYCTSLTRTAFEHDLSQFAKHCENNRKVIEFFGSVLAGMDRLLILFSRLTVAGGEIFVSGEITTAYFASPRSPSSCVFDHERGGKEISGQCFHSLATSLKVSGLPNSAAYT